MPDLDLIKTDIHAFLAKHEAKQLLRFVTIGSVDDGKSTLIGRMLYDTGAVYDDQIAAITKRDAEGREIIDLANLTDGLQAEREQGITIDVAYRYFSTEKRKFIIADCPGHVQYTRNMATGASTADVAIILIDARHGVLQQTRRHSTIVGLLGIRHLIVAINKMDLVDYSEARYEEILAEFRPIVEPMGFASVTCVPVSALLGENIARRATTMPWYSGETILSFLETVPIPPADPGDQLIFPVQYVLRPDLNFRGFAGTLVSGVVRPGDRVTALPSGKTSTVRRVVTMGADLKEAFAPQSVVLTLGDEIDISRGDVLVREGQQLHVARQVEADVVWLAEQPMVPGRQYVIKHLTRSVSGAVDHVHHRIDMDSLEQVVCQTLSLNDIGRVTLSLNRPLMCTAYEKNREAGAFIIVDRLENTTVGAGMIVGFGDEDGKQLSSQAGRVSPEQRAARFAQTPAVIWMGGRHGIGKMPIAHLLERQLFEAGHQPFCLDLYDLSHITIPAFGDDVSRILDQIDLCLDMGLIVITACTMPQAADRRRVRAHLEKRLGEAAVIDVHLEASKEACVRRILADGRDTALCDIAYEEPAADAQPHLVIDAEELTPEGVRNAAERILGLIQDRRLIR